MKDTKKNTLDNPPSGVSGYLSLVIPAIGCSHLSSFRNPHLQSLFYMLGSGLFMARLVFPFHSSMQNGYNIANVNPL
jgi:hypothetical protein